MRKEKQIEGLARAICKSSSNRGRCEVCGFFKYKSCHKFEMADDAYNAGYRKQSEGEWIFEHEFYGKMLCSNCKEEALVNECNEYVDSDFCPNCGAKMKGA